ncbi:MAG TPA: SDR family oxidoreductase [Gemmatimonadaceae bacterium]|jgi:NADP-dependent 3-hydroxy acid dehydrogenase YdfG|nr:SDR family oxidoreductase [Gemmatimonadaceae bacterium]
MPLAGRAALVTGASRGIGLATARSLGTNGARVALVARSADALREHAQSIGNRALALPCDLLDGEQIAKLIDRVLEAFGGAPDILVLNAGVFSLGRIGEQSPVDFAQTLALNLGAPYILLHAFVPLMRARGDGHVVSIGSIADRAAYPENGAYAAAKFGARALHEVLRLELAGSGVRASLVSPGPVDTDLWDPIDPDHRPGFTPRAQMLQAEAVADAVLWVVTRPRDVNIDELRLTRA